ncbi:MAG: proline racemase [Ignavibacteriales bacterium CG_4_9_14_3_um_filter_30_11]|nr:MAG: proline racemase [Ignavibacteriales bacterium CG_4_9_14_3_um_filter_30_11]
MNKSFSDRLKNIYNWNPNKSCENIFTVDAHTEGEPLRVIIGGLPELKGNSVLERRRYIKENFDHIRKALMWEPRGHGDMYGCIVTPPFSKEADFGVIFTHNEGYSTMCGHGIIAVTKVMLETGFIHSIEPITKIKIDSPAGLITAFAKVKKGTVESVSFQNVPSFVYSLDRQVEVKGVGKVKYDIAFGGAFYAFVDASSVGLNCTPDKLKDLIDFGMKIKIAVMKKDKITHPFEKDLNFLYGTIFISPPLNKKSHSRNVCIFADGEVDRSPTGTGVSARMALHHKRNEIKIGQKIIIESIIGTTFTVSVISTTQFGKYDAVIPEVEGTAFITGKNQFIIDPNDNLKDGFLLK